jgi:hypothetical protein
MTHFAASAQTPAVPKKNSAAFPQRPQVDQARLDRGSCAKRTAGSGKIYMPDRHQYIVAAAGDSLIAFTLH